MNDEFRTNAPGNNDGNRKLFVPTKEIVSTVVAAVHSTGVAYGGVDILITNDAGDYLISEVNTPCFYSETERITGQDISSKIVALLASKVTAG
jgi:glutathione synthase/RimK-type ligase-like ATP-grasp enzyme